MSEQIETLIQRFLDAELNRAERQALLRLLGTRSDLRQRLLDDEAMLDAAATLPRATPAPDFVTRTLARLPEQTPATVASSFQGPDVDSAARPRRPIVRWMSAAAAACLLVASGFWIGRTYDTADPPAANATSAAEPAEVLVRLVLIEPQAQSVFVVGDFNGWDPASAPLERRDGGVWSTTLPLAEGRYHYMFLIDGSRWLVDPLAAETSLDGFGARNSVLDIEL